ncbi:MAG TPA: hypothetical protein PKY82_00450 [Pyrinomonadaceae bacterium]|nr:hypothetical protein [Pyrinomonadaceae bacterium]
MLRKLLSMLVIALLINLSFVAVLAETKAEKDAKFADKVKANIIKLGVGKESRVEIKLKDGTKLKGYISQINENSFVVVEDKTGSPTEVLYPQTKQVKGNNLSSGVKIAIIAGIFIGVLIAVLHARGE